MPKLRGLEGGSGRACRMASSSLLALLLFAVMSMGPTVLAAEAAPGEQPEELATSAGQATPADQMESMQVSHSPETTDALETEAPGASIAASDLPLLALEQGVRPVVTAPGGRVTIRVPLVINPELVDWTGQIQNLIVTPLPEEAENWPLSSPDSYPQRALPDLSPGARVEAIFTFTVERNAGEGSYALPFGVSYGTMDEHEELREGFVVVECPLEVELSGTMVTVGAVSSQGLLSLDTEKIESYEDSLPQSIAGGELILHLPIINNGDELTEVSIVPKVSSSLSEFPFVTDGEGLVQSIDALRPGESAEVTFVFRVDEEAAAGRVPLQFTAVYREGERLRESHFMMDVEILGDGTEAEQENQGTPDDQSPEATPPGGPSAREQSRLSIVNYSVEPVRPVGGETFTVALTLQNEDAKSAVKNVQIAISSIQADGEGKTEAIFLVDTVDNVLGIQEMAPDESLRHTLLLQCSERASSGVHVMTVQLDYEDGRGKQHQTVQPVTLNIVQPVLLQVGTPRFAEGEDRAESAQEMQLILPLTNEGRMAIQGIRIQLQSEDWTLVNPAGELRLQPGEERQVQLALMPQKAGALQGEIYVEYANAAGEPIQERVAVSHTQIQKEAEQVEREIDEDGYWVLRDEQGNVIQRINPETGEPVAEKKGVSISVMVALLAIVFVGGSALGVLLYRRRNARKP